MEAARSRLTGGALGHCVGEDELPRRDVASREEKEASLHGQPASMEDRLRVEAMEETASHHPSLRRGRWISLEGMARAPTPPQPHPERMQTKTYQHTHGY
jgi:hypothetical protein